MLKCPKNLMEVHTVGQHHSERPRRILGTASSDEGGGERRFGRAGGEEHPGRRAARGISGRRRPRKFHPRQIRPLRRSRIRTASQRSHAPHASHRNRFIGVRNGLVESVWPILARGCHHSRVTPYRRLTAGLSLGRTPRKLGPLHRRPQRPRRIRLAYPCHRLPPLIRSLRHLKLRQNAIKCGIP